MYVAKGHRDVKWGLIMNAELRRHHLTDAAYEVRLYKCALAPYQLITFNTWNLLAKFGRVIRTWRPLNLHQLLHSVGGIAERRPGLEFSPVKSSRYGYDIMKSFAHYRGD